MNGVKRFLIKIDIDRAIFYVLLGKGWGVVSGALTIIFISKFLTAEYQGYYYTFSSIIALQVFFELGLGSILVQFASHEMGKLKFKNGNLEGDPASKSRLLSLIKLTLKWYFVIALSVLIVVSIAGYYFFDENLIREANVTSVNWIYPWTILVVLTSISMYFMPIIAIAEGCGLVVSVNKMRVKQAIISSLVAWGCLITGNGLYATSAMAFSIVTIGGWWLYKNFINLIVEAFYIRDKKNKISWLSEIFPMQWRIALSWISGYFILQFLTPLAFKSYGPVFAGQLGLSLSVCSLMLNLSMAWVNTKIPYWGKLISQNKHNELDVSYEKSFKYSCLFFILMISVASGTLFVLGLLDIELVNRVLPMSSFIFLCLCMLGHQIVSCQATYVRTHKIELYTHLSVFTAIVVFLSVYFVSVSFSYEFMMPMYFIGTWFLFVPWSTYIFTKFRISKNIDH